MKIIGNGFIIVAWVFLKIKMASIPLKCKCMGLRKQILSLIMEIRSWLLITLSITTNYIFTKYPNAYYGNVIVMHTHYNEKMYPMSINCAHLRLVYVVILPRSILVRLEIDKRMRFL